MARIKPSGKIHVEGVHFYEELDERVVRLVAALNSLHGVYTISSCGGHRKPDKLQVSVGEFRVSFIMTTASVSPFLRLIHEAIRKVDIGRLVIKKHGSGPRVTYELKGSDGVDPDEMASALESFVAKNPALGQGSYRIDRPSSRVRRESNHSHKAD
ncbi:MAG: hypothetical protein MI923_09665 [Phycisphaerales bacterium]|nr:hypothetical protein [Phycisphaerales bacterium]